MDIEEYKKFVKDKIDSENLTKKVRNIIKEVQWQKQDMREGFTETFNPLIKSQDSIKKSIDEQQNKTIEQLKKNQLALTQGFDQFNRLVDMRELPALEGDNEKGTPSTSEKKTPTRYNIEKNLDKDDLAILKNMNYPRPNDFFDTNPKRLIEIQDELKNDLKIFTGQIAGLNRKKQKTEDEKMTIEHIKIHKDLLNKYKNILKLYLRSLDYQTGQGMNIFNDPYNIIKRLELLAASINAGNNGVIPEFSQIAHLLKQMNVISNKQLNDLLKTYINI